MAAVHAEIAEILIAIGAKLQSLRQDPSADLSMVSALEEAVEEIRAALRDCSR
jgi:hypothetical protein